MALLKCQSLHDELHSGSQFFLNFLKFSMLPLYPEMPFTNSGNYHPWYSFLMPKGQETSDSFHMDLQISSSLPILANTLIHCFSQSLYY